MTLVVDQLSIASDRGELFSDLSFSVANGDILSVMGPSGSGKTTLLNFILGSLDSAFFTTGMLSLDGNSLLGVPSHRRRIGLQFQDHLLFPHMTVGENLAFGLPRQYSKSDRWDKVLQALSDCGLEGFEHYAPKHLSGGQQARISLMRTLLSEPCLVLLDEPFSKLDSELRGQFRDFVFGQIRSRMIPAIMVTHDAQDIEVSSRIINLQQYHSKS